MEECTRLVPLSNVWTWATAPADVGDYTVYAYVRDGKQAGPNAYDTALFGSTYSIQDPLAPRKLTSGRAVKAMPFLVTTGAGYLMVYQSMENGLGNKGDIASKVLGSSWNTMAAFWIAADPATRDRLHRSSRAAGVTWPIHPQRPEAGTSSLTPITRPCTWWRGGSLRQEPWSRTLQLSSRSEMGSSWPTGPGILGQGTEVIFISLPSIRTGGL